MPSPSFYQPARQKSVIMPPVGSSVGTPLKAGTVQITTINDVKYYTVTAVETSGSCLGHVTLKIRQPDSITERTVVFTKVGLQYQAKVKAEELAFLRAKKTATQEGCGGRFTTIRFNVPDVIE